MPMRGHSGHTLQPSTGCCHGRAETQARSLLPYILTPPSVFSSDDSTPLEHLVLYLLHRMVISKRVTHQRPVQLQSSIIKSLLLPPKYVLHLFQLCKRNHPRLPTSIPFCPSSRTSKPLHLNVDDPCLHMRLPMTIRSRLGEVATGLSRTKNLRVIAHDRPCGHRPNSMHTEYSRFLTQHLEPRRVL